MAAARLLRLRVRDSLIEGKASGQVAFLSAFTVALIPQRLNWGMEEMAAGCILNCARELKMKIPVQKDPATPWARVIDTSLDAPDDFAAWGRKVPLLSPAYRVAPRSVAVQLAG